MKNFSLLISTLTTLLLSPAFFPVVHSTTFTFVNKCNYTVWPGILSSSANPPLSTTGFSLQKNDSRAIPVPSGWVGRLWGRTYCSQNSTGNFSCVTGDCGSGKVECSGRGGAPPATLAEFSINAGAGDVDFYDVSLVEGYNLPMMVVPQGTGGKNCNSTGCAADLNGSCPWELRVTSASQSGKTVACNSPCASFGSGTPQFCCTGAYSSPETCKPSLYSQMFKNACPTAYSYAYDDGTSTFTCTNADYVITFCPSLNISSEQRQSPELNNGTSPSPFEGGSPELYNAGSPENPLLVIILVPVIITILVSSALSFYYYMRRRTSRLLEEKHNIKNRELLASELNALGELGDTSQPESSDKDNRYPFFSFYVIKSATNDFSVENKLGRGGFGPVYKGKLKNGKEIAVKRLSRSSSQGIRQFRNEVLLISKLQHRNLVRLLGCCIQGEERLLIYEYLPNNSLDSFIFDATKKALLDWSKRFSIIQGIAQGLLYLHKYSRLRIIHRDLKTSNILLDNELNPKISDFGTARIFGDNESSANTGTIVGTYGYMSPEYAMEGLFSEKSDVFSYGVMMLEIIGSRKNTSFYHCNRFVNLLGYAWDLWKEGKSLELMDSGLQEEPMPQNEVVRCIHIALMCVQENATDRPNMSEVVFMLTQDTTTNLPAPKQPAFIVNTSAIEERPNQDLISVSVNEVTISEIQGR